MSIQQAKTSNVTMWERFHAKMIYFHTIDDFLCQFIKLKMPSTDD